MVTERESEEREKGIRGDDNKALFHGTVAGNRNKKPTPHRVSHAKCKAQVRNQEVSRYKWKCS